MDLQKRLLCWRKRCGLTLLQVSKRSGVNISTIAMAERGERDLHTRRLARVVLRAFRITMPEFWGSLPRAASAQQARAA